MFLRRLSEHHADGPCLAPMLALAPLKGKAWMSGKQAPFPGDGDYLEGDNLTPVAADVFLNLGFILFNPFRMTLPALNAG